MYLKLSFAARTSKIDLWNSRTLFLLAKIRNEKINNVLVCYFNSFCFQRRKILWYYFVCVFIYFWYQISIKNSRYYDMSVSVTNTSNTGIKWYSRKIKTTYFNVKCSEFVCEFCSTENQMFFFVSLMIIFYL